MRNSSLRSNRGQALMGIVITASVGGILWMAAMSMLSFQGKATRNVAARGGVLDLSTGLDTLFGAPGCRTLGTSSFSSAGSPVTVTVGSGCTDPTGYCATIDTIKFKSGAIVVSTTPD